MALRVDFSSRVPSFKTTVKTEGLEVVEVKSRLMSCTKLGFTRSRFSEMARFPICTSSVVLDTALELEFVVVSEFFTSLDLEF